MKKNIKRIVSIFIILIIVIPTMLFLQENCFILNNHNTWRTRMFYKEEKNTVDVVLAGASELFSGYSSGLAYEKYGFTSYPYALDSLSIEVWKSQLREIKSNQTPKFIVIEINSALYIDDSKIFDEASLRRYIDNIPFSENKLKTLFECKYQDDFLSYLFPYIKYHGDIENAINASKEKVFFDKRGFSITKGMFTCTDIDKTKSINSRSNICNDLNPNAERMLIDFLNYCKENNYTNIIFTRFPHKYSDKKSLEGIYRKNKAKKIIEEQGFVFLDLENDAKTYNINSKTDFYNSDHLNVYGMEKLTNYLGKILCEKYGLSRSNLSEKEKSKWKESVEYTNLFINYAKQLIDERKTEWLSENKELYDVLDSYRTKE